MPPLLMGVINVTPDSFSDGGRFLSACAACDHGLKLVGEGADWLDIGGESTRPGAAPVSVQEELDRTVPVIEAIRREAPTAISIDTSCPEVARAAFAAGASLWNDVRALSREGSLEVARDLKAQVCLMHMQGAPSTMQIAPRYTDVVAEVIDYLNSRIAALVDLGHDKGQILVDPGIGFGKTVAHNLALLRAVPEIERDTGCPVLIGASRKSLIGLIDPAATSPIRRLGGSLAIALDAARRGAHILRVHDVFETRQALAVAAALGGASITTSQSG
jgi:dihydropteroate synthase